MNETELEIAVSKAVSAKVKQIKLMMTPQFCFTCRFFKLRIKKPQNRVCKYQGELKVDKRGKCLCWKIEEDSSKWVYNRNMSV